MSFLNNPQVVETRLDELKVTQRDIEIGMAYDAIRDRQRRKRRRFGLPGWLKSFAAATWRHRPHKADAR